MKKVIDFINKYGMVIITPLILIMFLKTCSTNSRVDSVTKQVEMTNQKIDSLEMDFENENSYQWNILKKFTCDLTASPVGKCTTLMAKSKNYFYSYNGNFIVKFA